MHRLTPTELMTLRAIQKHNGAINCRALGRHLGVTVQTMYVRLNVLELKGMVNFERALGRYGGALSLTKNARRIINEVYKVA